MPPAVIESVTGVATGPEFDPGCILLVHMRIFVPMGVSVAVVGASGYGGGELLRYLHNHPQFQVETIAAHSMAGTSIASVHPGLFAYAGRVFDATDAQQLAAADLVFLALPHGESGALAASLPSEVKIVDLGADHRLVSAEAWQEYYGTPHSGQAWTYGLPEVGAARSAVEASDRVANPGCYATAIQLAAAPAVAAGIVDPSRIVVTAASGTSGAGRKGSVELSASEVMGSLRPYKVGGSHQHIPEIEQGLADLTRDPVRVTFTPVLAPMPRGILATVSMPISDASANDVASDTTTVAARVLAAYEQAYADEPFVHLCAPGQLPSTAAVTGTNQAMVSVHVDEHSQHVVALSAIDNLGKGAAGQAIQNANIMFGFDETTGLDSQAVAP